MRLSGMKTPTRVGPLVVAFAAAAGCAAASAPPTGVREARSATAVERHVNFNGVRFDLPDGWRTARPGCGPLANDTVVVGRWYGSCPAQIGHIEPTTGVRLTALYGRQYVLGWPGRRTSWYGQPAWLAHRAGHGLTTYSLALPWLNAVIWAHSGDAVAAERLLLRVHQRRAPGLAVPNSARSVFVESFAGHDGDGLRREVNLTRREDISRLLADLRALPLVTAPGRACSEWSSSTATLTIRGASSTRTYAARFDACRLVIGGTGSAASTSQRLLEDLRRLVPNAGL